MSWDYGYLVLTFEVAWERCIAKTMRSAKNMNPMTRGATAVRVASVFSIA